MATVYKGKVTHRSWPQLPHELVRHIATFYLWDLAATNYCPQVWDMREHWHSRMVYAALRDSSDVERFMLICPQWSLAVETHPFWQHAVSLIDPMDFLAHNAFVHPKLSVSHNSSSHPFPVPTRLTPYRHFRNITTYSCLVCRINSPAASTGLNVAKRTISTPFLGTISLCRDHDRRRLAFCGLCLRETPLFETATAIFPGGVVGCVENEDDKSWPGVDATCRTCRREWLWRRMCGSPKDREAIGGNRFASEDWETRQSVDGFVDLGEGSINDVVELAREKWWLRKHTRLGDMMMQALAAARFNSGERGQEGYSDEELEEEEEDEDEEEDVEVMQVTEESVRELSLGDWARMRILDGHWFSPADQWYNNALPGRPMVVRAVHPCPWTREVGTVSLRRGEGGEEEEEEHPSPVTVNSEMPPSYGLCEQAYVAHQRQMRVVLLPAMRNIVRRLVLESAEGMMEDPAMRAAKMSMEDVLTMLREEEGVWFDGVDWAERKRNDGRRQREREKQARDDSSTSSGTSSSGNSDRSSSTTSPVLSTTTLQTTPSPPPALLGDDAKKEDRDEFETVAGGPAARVTIAVSPVLNPPRLLRPIPYVPLTASHMPYYSLEAFKAVWREACSPLYHCRCGICERAMQRENAEANKNARPGTAGEAGVPVVRTQAPASQLVPVTSPVEIRLVEGEGEGEDEVDAVERSSEDGDGVEVVEDGEYEDEYDSGVSSRGYTPPPPPPHSRPHSHSHPSHAHTQPQPPRPLLLSDTRAEVMVRSRKRSCDEIEDQVATRRSGSTPPKRARREREVTVVDVDVDVDVDGDGSETESLRYSPTSEWDVADVGGDGRDVGGDGDGGGDGDRDGGEEEADVMMMKSQSLAGGRGSPRKRAKTGRRAGEEGLMPAMLPDWGLGRSGSVKIGMGGIKKRGSEELEEGEDGGAGVGAGVGVGGGGGGGNALANKNKRMKVLDDEAVAESPPLTTATSDSNSMPSSTTAEEEEEDGVRYADQHQHQHQHRRVRRRLVSQADLDRLYVLDGE